MASNGAVVSPNPDASANFPRYRNPQTKFITIQRCKAHRGGYNEKLIRKNVISTLKRETCLDISSSKLYTALSERQQIFGDVKSIHLENYSIGYFQINLFRNSPNLRILNLSSCLINDDCIKIISIRLVSLEELNLSNCTHITDDNLMILSSGLKNLRTLHLNGKFLSPMNSITDDGISYITGYHHKCSGFPSLEHLNLSHIWSLTDDSLKYISQRLVNLVSLDLGTSERISNDGLGYLIRLRKLKSLSLAHCSGITNDGLKTLRQLKKLNHLNLDGCKLITNTGLKYISKHKILNHLDLSHCNLITDIGLKHISWFQNLNYLDLSYCNLINGLEYVSLLTNLKYLNLGYCTDIVDCDLEELTALPALRTLKFPGCNISSTGLGNLTSGILKLEELDLSFCHSIGDVGLKYIGEGSFKSTLLNLCLDCCKIGDPGINYILEGCLNIEKFSVKFCSNVTVKAWRSIAKRIRQSESK